MGGTFLIANSTRSREQSRSIRKITSITLKKRLEIYWGVPRKGNWQRPGKKLEDEFSQIEAGGGNGKRVEGREKKKEEKKKRE